ncbi:MAG: ACT domain-containing protein [Thermoflexaceae bacterium]|nr:ACT domain-containing protein [Thermoflexaceae bacterium]
MTVYRSIRVQITDRPGALFAITAALAAHGVDIVRLDVISSDGTIVVDDLFLGAPSAAAIGDACASFPATRPCAPSKTRPVTPCLKWGPGSIAPPPRPPSRTPVMPPSRPRATSFVRTSRCSSAPRRAVP